MERSRDLDAAETWTGHPAREREHDFALVIGVDHYPRFRSLQGAITDATAFQAWACAADGGRVAQEHARLILSTAEPVTPVQDQIDEALLELLEAADQLGGGRRLYFYFSGHGAMSPDLVGDDVALLLAKWSVSRARLALSSRGYLARLAAMGLFEELVVFLDCCRATAAHAVGLPPTITYEPASERCPTRTFLAYATEAGRAAFERPQGELWRGVFTRRLLSILEQSGVLSAGELKDRLEQEITEAQQAHVINGLRAGSSFGPRAGSQFSSIGPAAAAAAAAAAPAPALAALALRKPGARARAVAVAVAVHSLDSLGEPSEYGAADLPRLPLLPPLPPLPPLNLKELPRATTFVVESDPDVLITVREGAWERLRGEGIVHAKLEPGRYRVQLERAGRRKTRTVDHDWGAPRLRLAGPLFQTPAVLDGAAAAHAYYAKPVVRLGTQDTGPPLGPVARGSRLSIFLRREARDRGPPRLPSEPVTIHDATGRRLLELGRDTASIDDERGYVACSLAVAPGTYRLRAARTRRDIAITIPAGRAAHVFIADVGHVRLDDLRVALRPVDTRFDPASKVARAMESVIAALRAPDQALPEVARALLPAALDEDLCFGVAAAHLLWRSRDLPTLDRVMASLVERADDLPDVAILDHLLAREAGRLSPRLVLSAPPLLRASLVAAMARGDAAGFAIDPAGAIGPAARTALHDSIWCTWSDRPWDARWIEPTLGELRARTGDAASIARAVALPTDTVQRVLERIDAKPPAAAGEAGQAGQAGDARTALDLVAETDAPLDPARACELVLQALDALERLHARGIIHGGVEPNTLLVRADGSATLADRVHASPPDRHESSAAGGVQDSLLFAPREQILESPQARPAADVWSIAATLYFLLTLELPRDIYADQTELEAALHNPVVPIAERRPELPAALARCIDRALSDDPEARPADAAALRALLPGRNPRDAGGRGSTG